MSKRVTTAERWRFKGFIDAAMDYDEYVTPGDDAKTSKREFWIELKSHLGSNVLSTGFSALEQLVDDLLEGRSPVALRGPVVAMPSLPEVSSVPSATAKPSTTPPASTAKKLARGKRKTRSRPPPVKTPKKRRSSDKSAKSTPPLVPSAEYKALVDLNPDASDSIKASVYFILAKGEAVGRKPWCIAYP
ncbi:hypothetical protein PInf_002574 [Phytophthora infestans]|nr:hypothetical protein PInf_002574 [Phytophthora infestans]